MILIIARDHDRAVACATVHKIKEKWRYVKDEYGLLGYASTTHVWVVGILDERGHDLWVRAKGRFKNVERKA